jgi:hypothetical protein
LMENREQIVELALENSPLANEIIRFMEGRDFYESSPSELMEILNHSAKPENRNSEQWPRGKGYFSSVLQRLAPNLRQCGIDVKPGRSGGKRFIKLRKMNKEEIGK